MIGCWRAIVEFFFFSKGSEEEDEWGIGTIFECFSLSPSILKDLLLFSWLVCISHGG